ncbi:1768_t:CDS:2, partial [Gigaspora rosea]
ITHAFKRYICVGYDLVSREDIVAASRNIAGTSLANLEPNRDQEISPIAGYILAQLMPFIGNPIQFSPSTINLLCHKEIVRPDPKISDHTIPTSKWSIPIPSLPLSG